MFRSILPLRKLLGQAIAALLITTLTGCCCWNCFTPRDVSCSPQSPWAPPPCATYPSDCLDSADFPITYPESSEPLDVAQLIDIALCNNPNTYVSWSTARSNAFQLEAARSELYPTVDAAGAISHVHEECCIPHKSEHSHKHSHNWKSESDQRFDVDVHASYLLYNFGGRSANISSACYALQSANWSHNRTIQTVMIEVLRRYYAYIDAKTAFEAKNKDLEDAHANLEAAEHLYDSGITMRVDVLQAKSNLVGTRLELEELKREVHTRMGGLANALGLPASVELHVADVSETAPLEEVKESVEELMARARNCRPDLAASQAYYYQKQQDQCVARASGLPYLSANAGYHSSDYFNHSDHDYREGRVTLDLKIPLFNGCYYVNQERSAKANADAAYADMKGLESNVYLEVMTSYHFFKTAVEKFKYNQEFLDYTHETYEATLSSYKEGTSTILDVLAAQNSLASARAQWIRSRTEWLTAFASLAYATGTL